MNREFDGEEGYGCGGGGDSTQGTYAGDVIQLAMQRREQQDKAISVSKVHQRSAKVNLQHGVCSLTLTISLIQPISNHLASTNPHTRHDSDRLSQRALEEAF